MADLTSEKQYSYDSLEDRLIKEYFADSTPKKGIAVKAMESFGTYIGPFVGGFLAGISHEHGMDLERYQVLLLFAGPGVLAASAKGYISHLQRRTMKAVLSNKEARHDLLYRLRDDPDKFKKVREMKQQVGELSFFHGAEITLTKALVLSGAGYALGRTWGKYT